MYILFISTEKHNFIVDAIEEAKHKVWQNILASDQKRKSTIDIAKLMNEIKKSDAVVIESTESNFEMGRFTTLALLQHKPVLMLQKDKYVAPLVLGESRLVTQTSYIPGDAKEMKNILANFFKVVAKQRLLYRFNFMMSREMNAFVGEKAQESGVSKADYIRSLISEVMEH
jgi:hypothetical protein